MCLIVILLANHHYIINCHGNVEAILILNQYDILALEARDYSAPYFTDKSYFIAYFHIYGFLIVIEISEFSELSEYSEYSDYSEFSEYSEIPYYSGISSELSP